MKFVADESVDFQVVSRLRSDGHEVLYVAESLSGASDNVVVAQANRQSAVLVTADKDFGDLVFRQRLISSGILLLRIAGLSQENKAAIVAEAVSKHGFAMPERFTVLTSKTIRIRAYRLLILPQVFSSFLFKFKKEPDVEIRYISTGNQLRIGDYNILRGMWPIP